MLRQLPRRLLAVNVLTVVFSVALALLAISAAARIPSWRAVVATSAAIGVGLPLLAIARHRTGSRALALLHDWAFAPLAYVIYLEMHAVVGPLRGGRVLDVGLIAADRWLLGADAGSLLAPFATPWFTEVLQVAYTSFYVLVMAVAAELYLRRQAGRFRLYAFSCMVGFLVSFIGYVLVPAVGPRFTLSDVRSVERMLPGVCFTQALRVFVDNGGLVPRNLSKAAAAALAPRDVFPSGHTLLTTIAVYWSWRFRQRVRWVVAPVGALLVLATVYLLYHYVVDVLAGAALAVVIVAVTPALHAWVCRTANCRLHALASRVEGLSPVRATASPEPAWNRNREPRA